MRFVGIDIDGRYAYLSILERGGAFKNKRCKLADVKLFYKSKYVTTAIDPEKLLIKRKSLDVERRDLEKVVKFQEESITSLDGDRVLIETIIDRPRRELLFNITTKESLKKHLDGMEKLGIDTRAVSSPATAIMRFSKKYFPSVNELMMIHVKSDSIIACSSENGSPVTIYSSNAKDIKARIGEISRLIYGIYEGKNKKVPLLITGKYDQTFEMEFLSKNSKYITRSLIVENKEELPFAISIGLALDTYLDDDRTVQFRKGEFSHKSEIEKRGKSLFFSALFFMFFTASLFLFFKTVKDRNERELNLRVERLKEAEGYYKEGDIETVIRKISKKIKKDNKRCFYVRDFPKVSHIFSDLFNDPLLSGNDPKIKVVHINYKLQNPPTIKQPKKIPSPKIYIKFYAASEDARAFHKNLLDGGFKKVELEEDEGVYKISCIGGL